MIWFSVFGVTRTLLFQEFCILIEYQLELFVTGVWV